MEQGVVQVLLPTIPFFLDQVCRRHTLLLFYNNRRGGPQRVINSLHKYRAWMLHDVSWLLLCRVLYGLPNDPTAIIRKTQPCHEHPYSTAVQSRHEWQTSAQHSSEELQLDS